MKKIFLFTLLLIAFGAAKLNAQSPIPSFNVMVYPATRFQESLELTNNCLPSKGKRIMVITVNGTHQGSAVVYVYSLDGLTVFGPYTVNGGQTLFVEIDNRPWGVIVQGNESIIVDVWINEST